MLPHTFMTAVNEWRMSLEDGLKNHFIKAAILHASEIIPELHKHSETTKAKGKWSNYIKLIIKKNKVTLSDHIVLYLYEHK